MNPWKNIERLSRQDIFRLQNAKLKKFISCQLYPFSGHYQNLLNHHRIKPSEIKTIDDLRRIPFTSKVDFVSSDDSPEKPREFVLQPDKTKIQKYWPARRLLVLAAQSMIYGKEATEEKISREYRPVFLTFTTGTTNTPIPYLYSTYDLDNLYLSGGRMLKLFDIKTSERIVNIFPFAPHLAFWQVVFGGFSSGVFILSTGGGKVMSSEGNMAAILKMKPSVILGVPSYVYHLLRIAQSKNDKMDFIKKVVLGAAAVTDSFKLKLTDLLHSMGARDVSVFGTYGFTEARCAWAECPTAVGTSSGYHLYPDKEIIEIIDPKTGQVKKEGEDGEIVYTSIDSRGSAVIRYRTGDFVEGGITYQPCPFCKRTVGRLSSRISRISDVKGLKFSKIKGSLVNLNNFSTVLNDFAEIIEWQIEIRKKDNDPHEVDELFVYVCSQDQCNRTELEEEIRNKILLSTEVSPNGIAFCSLPEIVKRLELETAAKEKRIIDTRPKV